MSSDNFVCDSAETKSEMHSSEKLEVKTDESKNKSSIPSVENVDTFHLSDVTSRKIFAPKVTPENPVTLRSVSLAKAPMSSMEEENLRERLHIAQLKKCAEIVSEEARYTRDSFRRLFLNKVFSRQVRKYPLHQI
ncbi:hypothetical protein WA026_002973 [Henosepilachna vigintioctopunctata]|uniref:Uncharacterized protein n=1 Tax=Henosepilachna vigintioctopunctata TaxID=420089 RepID=A0AAW1TMS6_9CUCU